MLEIQSDVRREWGWLLALGVLFVIMGSVGIGMSVGLTLASMFFFGVLLLAGGILHLVDVFRCRKLKGAFWHGMIALFYVIAGGMAINEPFVAASFLTMILAVSLIIIGLSRMMWGFMLRDMPGWGWLVFGGLAALVLGVMILKQWPASGLWFIGLMIAIEFIMTGWTYVFLAIGLRRAQ